MNVATETRDLTVTQAAKKLNLSSAIVRRYCQNNRIPCEKVGNGMYLIRPEIVEMFAQIERKRGPKKNSEKA